MAASSRYLQTNKALGPRDVELDDPFWNAVAYESTDVVRMLLEHWDAARHSIGTDVPVPDGRGFGLLRTTCWSAHVETVRFLLNSPWNSAFGHMNMKDRRGLTALLAAAGVILRPRISPHMVKGQQAGQSQAWSNPQPSRPHGEVDAAAS